MQILPNNIGLFKSGLLLFIIFIASITICASTPYAEDGVLDLNETSLNSLVRLRGDWELYWEQFVDPETDISKIDLTGYEKIPGKWKQFKKDGKRLPGKGYLTLRLKILTKETGNNYALKFQGIATACKAYLNGELIFESGIPGASKKLSEAGKGVGMVHNLTLMEENELLLQVSNYDVVYGGLEDIYLGTIDKIESFDKGYARTTFFIFGCILIMAIYHLGLYTIRRKNISAFYFGIFCILIALRSLVTGDRFLMDIIQLRWNLVMKLEYLSFYLSAPAFIFFARSIFSKTFSKKFTDIFAIISGVFATLVIFTPSQIYTYTLQIYQVVTSIGGIYVIYITIINIKHKKGESILFLIGFVVLFLAVINDILYFNEVLHFTDNLAPAGLFVFTIFQSFLLATQFSNAEFHSEKLAKKLNYTNRNLSKIVEFRTAELEKQKLELVNQKIMTEEKNRDITDSLNYASKIQTAVLPDENHFADCFHDFFIYYEPKDIVSGDFYWVKRIRNKIIVVAADCTGHGVPGAFMSLLGIAFLNEIVNMMIFKKGENETILPNKILDELRKKIKSALRQTGDLDDAFDGIDMALCIIDYAENKLHYSGANNSLYVITHKPKKLNIKHLTDEEQRILVDENENSYISEIKANRMPIGTYLFEKEFTNYEFVLDEIDCIYMFSDGFSDQIGGDNKTKFRLKKFKQLVLEISNKDFREQHTILRNTMEEWMDNEIGQIDDITVIGIKLHADRKERSFGLF